MNDALSRWSGMRVAVIGAGRSGVAAAELLAEAGADVRLTDSRPASRLPYLGGLADERVSVHVGGHPESLWRDLDAVCVSPGVDRAAPALEPARVRALPMLSEIELGWMGAQAPCVAITGSNGKSTVTTMVGAILQGAGLRAPVCGNIGTPFCRIVLESLRGQRQVDRYVLELSSFQTEAVADFHPRWAAILNVVEDHLDRHHGLDEYGQAKLRLLRNCTATDWVVYGADDPWLSANLPRDLATPVPFASAPPANGGPQAWVQSGTVYWRGPDGDVATVATAEEMRVVGGHNLLNAAAATALGCLAGAPVQAAREALLSFVGLPHRMQPCGQVDGVLCIDDSKATNVGATAASLGGLNAPLWLILGGRDKGSDFTRLRPLLQGRTRAILLIGEAAGKIAAALEGAAPLLHCGTMAAAVDTALAAATPGDALLLAPACTSFDQFDDFEHRGRHFQELVAARLASSQPERT